MNQNYRLIWNTKTSSWQVVSELAKSNQRSKGSKLQGSMKKTLKICAMISGVFALNALSISLAMAAPVGGVVSAGTATISTSGVTTTINQSTAKAAIDWTNFSTSASETVKFNQPSTNSITLNRVLGTSASTLNGKLEANGQVFIVNPNGVLFGNTSQVNVGGLVASTLDLSNTDFINDNYTFSNATNNKSVENRGSITVPTGGTIALVSSSIRQTGTMTAPQGNVLLAAASDVTLNLSNGSLVGYTINQGKAQALINSGGLIQADGGKVVLTAQGIDELSSAVVNSGGVIRANTVSNVRGVIELSSDMQNGRVNVAATLDASAPGGGDGGTITTKAAKVTVNNNVTVKTAGQDQSNLPPDTSGWTVEANDIDVVFFSLQSSKSNIASDALGRALDNGNVTLKTVQGDINLNEVAESWENTTLTLDSAQDIHFNSDLYLNGDRARLSMKYGLGHDYHLNDGAKINITGTIQPTLVINGNLYTVITELGEEGDANFNTLQGMQNNLSGNYALGTDIDASDTVNWNGGKGFDPIGQVELELSMGGGSGYVLGTPFTGDFHGLGHNIDNLTINDMYKPIQEGESYIPKGLFGVTYNSLLRDVSLINALVRGDVGVGSLVGVHLNGDIKNAHSSGRIQGFIFVGGLVGSTGINFDLSEQYTFNKIMNSSSGADVDGITAVGGLVGVSTSSIYDSYATGNIALMDLNISLEDLSNMEGALSEGIAGLMAGGLVGSGTGIYNSYATGNISKGININNIFYEDAGFALAGGLAGAISLTDERSDYVDQSYATGNVVGSFAVGGLVGGNPIRSSSEPKLYINNSYATGNVEGNMNVGGLVGANAPGNIINSSYSIGHVTGVTGTGGLVGYNNNGIITNSYWNTDTSGQLTSAGGIGKTTAELKQINTFTGWDIADISDSNSNSVWVIDEDNEMPTLRHMH